jgi:hypothetical protein
MGEVVYLSAYRLERAVVSREERIAALVALLPLVPGLEADIMLLRHEIWLLETEPAPRPPQRRNDAAVTRLRPRAIATHAGSDRADGLSHLMRD